jgi:hypothetical protein
MQPQYRAPAVVCTSSKPLDSAHLDRSRCCRKESAKPAPPLLHPCLCRRRPPASRRTPALPADRNVRPNSPACTRRQSGRAATALPGQHGTPLVPPRGQSSRRSPRPQASAVNDDYTYLLTAITYMPMTRRRLVGYTPRREAREGTDDLRRRPGEADDERTRTREDATTSSIESERAQPKTVRKYERLRKLPSELKQTRRWHAAGHTLSTLPFWLPDKQPARAAGLGWPSSPPGASSCRTRPATPA